MDHCSFKPIFYFEVEPLEISCAIWVRPQKYIITFTLSRFYNQINISTFKIWIKIHIFIFLSLKNIIINVQTKRIHSNKFILLRNFLGSSWAKNLFNEAVVLKPTSIMIFGKVKLISLHSIAKLFVRKLLVHLIRVNEIFRLVN